MRVFDLHCDTPYKYLLGETPIVNGDSIKSFSSYKACTALWIDDRDPKPFVLYKRLLSAAKKVQFDHLLTLEGFCFANGPDTVDLLKKDGICAATLTWNYNNRLAGGCLDDGILTALGKSIIRRMNECGIMLDLSHINERSFFPALEQAEKVYISHGNLKSICNHPRNITNEQAKALAGRGGIIGICLYPDFLGADVFEKVYENIVTAEDLGLKTALGSDFDGAIMHPKLNSPEKLYDLRDFLAKKGFSNYMLEDFFYKNAESLFIGLYKSVTVI